MRSKKAAIFSAILATFSAFAATVYALNNDQITITRVEVTRDQVLIWTNAALSARPACSTVTTIMGCSLEEPYCERAMSVALAAQMSGREVDAQLTNTCVPGQVTGVSRFDRIRVR